MLTCAAGQFDLLPSSTATENQIIGPERRILRFAEWTAADEHQQRWFT